MKSGSPISQVAGRSVARSPGAAAELGRQWRSGNAPPLEDFLAEWSSAEPRSAVSTRELASLVSLDQRERWRRGQRPAAEEYLRRFPQLLSDEELVLDVIYSEFLLREELGQEPKPLEYQLRFPEFAETLQDQIEFHQAMAANGSSRLSDVDTRRSGSAAQLTRTPDAKLPAHLTHFVPGYEILSELGRGGMGIVYRAKQLSLNRLVALKMLRAGDCGSAALLARFQAEAEAVARLHHPNIVQIYDYGEHDGMPYLALELIEGGPLSASSSGKARNPRDAAEIVVTLARAVQFAHEQGIVHRDLKPANILLRKSEVGGQKSEVASRKSEVGRGTAQTSSDLRPPTSDLCPKIADFGLAKVFREGEESHTQTGTIVGTPCYMAPEQARGQSPLVGPATDVYALGAILYELLTGQPPFKAATAIETLHLVLTTEAVSPARHQPRLPRDLVTIVTRCLHKEPRLRYGTAAELADDLDRFLSDRPVRARRTSVVERGWRWCRRNPAVALLFTSVAVLLVAVAAVSSISSIRLSAQLQRTQQAEDAQRTAKQTAQHRLWDAYLAEISAQTAGRHLGRRFAALETSERASALLDQIGRTPERELELRSATIAALALPDLRLLRRIDARGTWDLDCALAANRYVIASGDELSVCDLDGRELVHIEHRWSEPAPVISRDGRYVGVSDLACAKIWRIDGELAELIWEEAGASRLDLAPDCRHAAVVGADRLMHWLDLTTGQKVRQLGRGPGQSAFCFHESSRRIAVMGDRGIQIIDWETGETLAELPASPAAPFEFSNLAWHPGGEFIATSYDDEGVMLWHVSSGRRILAFPHMGIVRVCFVGSGDYLLTVNVWDARLRMWHTGTGQEVLSDPTFPSFRSEMMPDGRQLLLAGNAEGVTLWEVESAQACTSLPHRLTPSMGWRTHTSISPDGRWLLVSASRGLELWDLTTAQLAGWLESGPAYGVFASDGSIVARFASGVFRWPLHRPPSASGDWARFGPPEKLYGTTTELKFAMSPDAGKLVVRTSAGWRTISPAMPEIPMPIAAEVDPRTVAISKDARWLALGSWNGHGVTVFSPSTGERVAHLTTGPHAFQVFSPDSRWLATTPDGVRVWSVPDWKSVAELRARGDTASELGIAFSPDSSVLAVSQPTGATRLVDPATGADWAVLNHPDKNAGLYLAFSRDQSKLVTAPPHENMAVSVWNLVALREELDRRGLDWPPFVLPRIGAASDSSGLACPLDVSFDRGATWPKEEAASLESVGREARTTSRRDVLMRIIRIDPDNARAHNELSWLLSTGPANLRDPALAVFHARRAVALVPDNHNFLNSLGAALQRAGKHEEAIQALQKALAQSSPQLAPYDLVFLALAHAGLAEWQAASDYFHRTTAAYESQRHKLTSDERDELELFLEEARALGLPR
jgi:serine/threonine protein kinase/WD40 repeat protein